MRGIATPSTTDEEATAPAEAEEDLELEIRTSAVAEEKRRALLDPGPTWREWLYYEAFKWWLAIALLVVDGWAVAYWLEAGSVVGAALSLAALVYVEYLLYQYLWFRPASLHDLGHHQRWLRPTPVGRWTPEWSEWRRMRSRATNGPRLEEFL